VRSNPAGDRVAAYKNFCNELELASADISSLLTASLGKNVDHVCPICNSRYSNIGNFKLHMKSHDNDHLREQRNQIIGEMVSTCFGQFRL
jgi:hypothetical protein